MESACKQPIIRFCWMIPLFLMIYQASMAQKWAKQKPDKLYAVPKNAGSSNSSSDDGQGNTHLNVKVGIGTNAPKVRLHVAGDGDRAASFLNGKVGIGTLHPTEALEIDGNLKLSGQLFGDQDLNITGEIESDKLHVLKTIEVGNSIWLGGVPAGGVNEIYTDDGDLHINSKLGLNYNTLINANVTNTGRVGIGTEFPASVLHVKRDNAINPSMLIMENATGISGINIKGFTDMGVIFGDPAAANPVFIGYKNGGDHLAFNGGHAENGLILKGDRVGIGLVNPAGRLHVRNDDTNPTIDVFENVSGQHFQRIKGQDAVGLQFYLNNDLKTGINYNEMAGMLNIGSVGGFRLQTGSIIPLHITSGGKIGISDLAGGLTNPGAMLHVSGDIQSFESRATVMSSYESLKLGDYMFLDRVDGSGETNNLYTTFGMLHIQSNPAYTQHTIINANNSGKVGIGTGTPATKLDVDGVITATGGDSDDWNDAYDWSQQADDRYVLETDFDATTAAGITSADVDNWNTAHGWGDHTLGNYLSNTELGIGSNQDYIPQWDGTNLVASIIREDGNNIGIGITPTSKLSVAGTIEAVYGGFKFPDETVQTTAFTNSVSINDLEVATTIDADDIVTMTLFAEQIGIDTDDPQEALGVKGSIRFYHEQSFGNIIKSDWKLIPKHNANNMSITNGITGNDVLYLKGQNGHVGIGKTPDVALDVNGDIKGGELTLTGRVVATKYLRGSSVVVNSQGKIFANVGNSDEWNAAVDWIDANQNTFLTAETDPKINISGLNFLAKWDGSKLVGSRIKDDGTDITMGNDFNPQPDVRLTVRGQLTARENFTMYAKDNLNNLVNEWEVLASTEASFLTFRDKKNAKDVMMLDGKGGQVGIGTDSPGEALDVEGNIRAAGTYILDNMDNVVPRFDNDEMVGGTIWDNGYRVGIGTTSPGDFKLAVEGKLGAREIEVKLGSWSDFVFEPGYELKPLADVENFIQTNKHLPDIPSEKEILRDGLNLGEMDALLLQKIEELTLYIIRQQKEIDRLKATREFGK